MEEEERGQSQVYATEIHAFPGEAVSPLTEKANEPQHYLLWSHSQPTHRQEITIQQWHQKFFFLANKKNNEIQRKTKVKQDLM